MAGPYPCDICGSNVAAVILGVIETGEQQFLCPPCFGRVGLESAQKLLLPEEIAQQLGPMFIDGGGGQPAPPKRARKRTQPPQETPEPNAGPETPEGLAEPEAAAPDS